MLHDKLNKPNLDFRITGGKGNQTICEMYLMPVDHKFLKEYFMPNRYLLNSNLPELYEYSGTDLADMTNQSSGMDFNFVTRGATKTLGFISYKSNATKNGMEYDYEIEIISDNLNKHKYWELIRATNRPIMIFARISNDYGILLGDYDGAPILSSDFQMGGRKKRNEFNIVLNWTASHPAFVTKVPLPTTPWPKNEMVIVPGHNTINNIIAKLKQAFAVNELTNLKIVGNTLYFDNENYQIINEAFKIHDVRFTKFVSAANQVGFEAFYNRIDLLHVEFTHLTQLTSQTPFDACNNMTHFIARNLTALSGSHTFNDCISLIYLGLDSLSSGIVGSSFPANDNVFGSIIGNNVTVVTNNLTSLQIV